MYHYKTSAELKSISKGQLLGNYGTAISVLLVNFAITWIISLILGFVTDKNTVYGIIIYYAINIVITLISSLFTPGIHYFYMNLISGRSFKISDAFYGFSYYPEKTLLITIIQYGILLICMLPCLIFGIVCYITKAITLLIPTALFGIIGYILYMIINLYLSQIFYLLLEFPDYSVRELLRTSKDLMKGHILRFFYLQISFLPLSLLNFLSCGIASFWLQPYMCATYTNFYFDLVHGIQAVAPQEHIDIAV